MFVSLFADTDIEVTIVRKENILHTVSKSALNEPPSPP